MSEFDTIEDTMFVPLLGRIYCSENFPSILRDEKALEIKDKLPRELKGKDTQSQYTLMASAVRSVNMDRCIREFCERNPDGIIVEFGCGLETAYYRNPNGHTWYELDLPEVIEYRREILGEPDGDIYIAGDAFELDWMERIRSEHPDAPVLVTAGGILHYFPHDKVIELFRGLRGYGDVEFVFDILNSKGMKRVSKYMEEVGHEDAIMLFYVDDAESLAQEAGVRLIREEKYYARTPKAGLEFMTSMTMRVSDMFDMVKMIHLDMDGTAEQ